MAGALPVSWHGGGLAKGLRSETCWRRRGNLCELEPRHRRSARNRPPARWLRPSVGGGRRRGRCRWTHHSRRDLVAPVRLPRLPASPIERSLEGRAFVFSGFAIAVLAIVLYGQDYIVPAVALAVAAIGHYVSYRGRDHKRTLSGQLLVAGLVFASLVYFLADSVGAIFGGVLPQANFAILLVAVTSFDLKTRRNCYSSLWISLAILYLAAVYAWDYPFGILVALWAICLAGFWMASHLRRLEATVAGPMRPMAFGLVGALALGLGGFILIPQPTAFAPTPLVVSLPNFTSFRGELENPALPLVQISGDPSGA